MGRLSPGPQTCAKHSLERARRTNVCVTNGQDVRSPKGKEERGRSRECACSAPQQFSPSPGEPLRPSWGRGVREEAPPSSEAAVASPKSAAGRGAVRSRAREAEGRRTAHHDVEAHRVNPLGACGGASGAG